MSLYGLVLAGGASTRMQRDKAALVYHDRPQLQWTYELLAGVCARTFVSVRADQAAETLRARYPQIVDSVAVAGPMAGILSALSAHPDDAWYVLACDLPFVDRATLDHLLSNRNAARVATAYRSARDGLPEPLCAIFEPQARAQIEAFRATGRDCPRKFLLQSDAHIVDLPNRRALDNVNTPEERTAAARLLPPPPAVGSSPLSRRQRGEGRGEGPGVRESTSSPHVSGERAGVRGSK